MTKTKKFIIGMAKRIEVAYKITVFILGTIMLFLLLFGKGSITINGWTLNI